MYRADRQFSFWNRTPCVPRPNSETRKDNTGMDGKSRKFDPAKGVVNTPMCVTGPRAPLRSNLDDPEEWELPSSHGLGLVRHPWRDTGFQLGRSQTRARSVGKHSRVLPSIYQTSLLPEVKG